MTTVHDLAAFILSRCGQMGPVKLQKLVYYCQAWATVWDGQPIFDEAICAWKHGPVVPDLWSGHRHEKQVAAWPRGDAAAVAPRHLATIDAVLGFYGKQDDWWLRDLSHAEEPWTNADQDDEITPDEMASFYARYPTPRHEISPALARGLSLLATLPAAAREGMLGETRPVDGIEAWLLMGVGDPWQTSAG